MKGGNYRELPKNLRDPRPHKDAAAVPRRWSDLGTKRIVNGVGRGKEREWEGDYTGEEKL